MADRLFESLVGREVSGYRIERRLGEGGMGAVFKAHQVRLDRPVALKVLPPLLSQDEDLIARFEREARAVARLSHPHIVQVHDLGKLEGGLYFIAMELCEGGSVASLLKQRGALEEPLAARIARQAALGLAAAAEIGVIHRDVKPDNLLLSAKGDVKVADFGLAKAAGSAIGITKSGTVMGTPAYMPPEQWHDARQCDHRSDLYALGCALYEMVTGSRPFAGPESFNYGYQHVHEPPPDPRAARPDASPGLCAVIARLLEKEPARRFQSGAELAGALEVLYPPTGLTPRPAVVEDVVATISPRTGPLPSPRPPRGLAISIGPPSPTPAAATPAGTGSEVATARFPRPPRGCTVSIAFGLLLAGGVTFYLGQEASIPHKAAMGPAADSTPTAAAPPPAAEPPVAKPPLPVAESPPAAAAPGAAPARIRFLDLAPRDGASLPGHAVEVSGRVDDPSVGSVRVNEIPARLAPDGRFALKLSAQDGDFPIDVRAGEGEREATALLRVFVDNAAPVVRLEAPEPGVPAREPSVLVRGRVEDARPARIEVGGAAVALRDGRFEARVPLASEGENRIALAAFDEAGNEGRAEVLVVRDTRPPALALRAPAEVEGEVARIEVEADEPLSAVEVDGVRRDASGTSLSIPVTVPQGGKAFSVRAFDRAGNAAERSVGIARKPAVKSPAYLGARVHDAADGGGAVVAELLAGSPAEKAGLRLGDRLVGLGADRIERSEDLRAAVTRLSAGDRVRISVVRGEETLELEAVLGARP